MSNNSKNQIGEKIVLEPKLASIVGSIPSLPQGQSGTRDLLEFFFSLFRDNQPDVFCDIGANRGEVGQMAKKILPAATVHGFEANKLIHDAYGPTAAQGGVEFFNLAVSDKVGEIEIFVPKSLSVVYHQGKLLSQKVEEPFDTGKGSILRRNEQAEYATQSVSTTTLDAFYQDAGNREFFLWIDVEGAAQSVLEGAKDVLGKTFAIHVELEGYAFWQNESTPLCKPFETLINAGFVPVLRDREYQDAQFNVIFVRRDDADRLLENKLADYPQACGERNLALRNTILQSKDYLPEKRKSQRSADIPVLIPCFNNPTYVRSMISQLKDYRFEDIRLIDNASTSPEMLALLEDVSGEVSVSRLQENLGPKASIFRKEFLDKLPNRFVVTDPDIAFNPALPADFIRTLERVVEALKVGKAGFALDISQRHLLNDRKYEIGGRQWHIWEWEQQFWAKHLGYTSHGDVLYHAQIDTTFALYDQEHLDADKSFLNAIRIGGRFTARHLPWYKSSRLPDSEERVYRQTQKHSFYLDN